MTEKVKCPFCNKDVDVRSDCCFQIPPSSYAEVRKQLSKIRDEFFADLDKILEQQQDKLVMRCYEYSRLKKEHGVKP